MSTRDSHHRKRDRSRSPGGDSHRHRRSEPSKSRDKDRDREREHRHRDNDSRDRESTKRRDSSRSPSRGDRDRDDRDDRGDRDRHREKSSRREHKDDEDSKKRSRRESEKATDRSNRDKDRERDRDRDHRRSEKSSRRDHRDKEDDRRRSRRRSASISESGSESGSDSGSSSGSDSGSESEEDEMVKKAKSMIQTISEDDYFTKSSEFRLWLRQDKKKYFEDLTADDARKYFKKFVRRWNDFELDESYYKGVRTSQIPTKSMTKYQWKFAKTIDKADLNKVESIKDSIDTMTNVRFAHEVGRLTGVSSASALDAGSGSGSGAGAGVKRTLGPSMPPPAATAPIGPRRSMTADEVAEKEEQDFRNRQIHRAEQKRYRKEKEVILEELVPKATGREAMLEKRRAQTAYHRRERSPDVELPEQDLMGSGNGGDDYKSMLAAERRRKEAREARRYGGGGGAGPGQPSSSYGPSAAGPSPAAGGGGGSVLGAKQQAYKEKEAKQMEEFRKLWAQTQANKGGL
ncbi:hypothetical protein BG015_007909 [Linnemannia schmuckeri]|uniref:Uncharacterized protein n=1 Tax=Linnemannia schmuckeri TaxID=64567 RepID=A0A9P5RXQ6_9FUNG|nr:hypothetical protein BG015_007909 [Linnemannia schmuckeri]